ASFVKLQKISGGTFESSVWIFWRRGVCNAARFGSSGSSVLSTQRRTKTGTTKEPR
ncbi:hypothetical protein ILYODFUR_009255, partial [Ilyodon furcidens]